MVGKRNRACPSSRLRRLPDGAELEMSRLRGEDAGRRILSGDYG